LPDGNTVTRKGHFMDKDCRRTEDIQAAIAEFSALRQEALHYLGERRQLLPLFRMRERWKAGFEEAYFKIHKVTYVPQDSWPLREDPKRDDNSSRQGNPSV
jgi:hypothetical protein